MNLLNLLSNYFILLWMPAILDGTGVASSWAIFVTTMYGVGVIHCSVRGMRWVDVQNDRVIGEPHVLELTQLFVVDAAPF
jgi:hypothetical protein